jgi:hypothetical protein
MPLTCTLIRLIAHFDRSDELGRKLRDDAERIARARAMIGPVSRTIRSVVLREGELVGGIVRRHVADLHTPTRGSARRNATRAVAAEFRRLAGREPTEFVELSRAEKARLIRKLRR